MENVRSNRGIRLSNRHDSGRELANPEKYQKKGNHKKMRKFYLHLQLRLHLHLSFIINLKMKKHKQIWEKIKSLQLQEKC